MADPANPARGDRDCDLCGRSFDTDAELAEHLIEAHGGLDGTAPGGTGGADSEAGSGPTGTTTSGGRREGTASDDLVDETTEGGAGRAQTE